MSFHGFAPKTSGNIPVAHSTHCNTREPHRKRVAVGHDIGHSIGCTMGEPSVTNNHDSVTNARSILKQLEGDFDVQGKRTCRECLRSKALPCAKVVEVSQNESVLKAETISVAHSILLKEYMEFPIQQGKSSLWYMNRIVTPLRFVQLLLCLPPETVPVNLGNKMTIETLQSFTRGLKQFMTNELAPRAQNQDEEDEYDPLTSDASTSLDSRIVLCFAISSLLRLNAYAKTRVALISSLWRGLCDLASDTLPASVLENLIQALVDYLQEGHNRLLSTATNLLEAPSPSAPQEATLALQTKLLCFLAARITRLIGIASSGSSAVIAGALKTLLSLRGLPIAFQILLVRQHESAPFLKICQTIASKVEKSLLGVVIRPESSTLQTLLRIKTKIPRKLGTSLQLSYMGLVLGKAKVLQGILANASLQTSDVESLLSTSEALCSVVLPKCYSALLLATSEPSEDILPSLVSDSLHVLSQTLKHIEASFMDPTKRSQFYRLMIRWMAPMASDDVPLHPISREVVVSLMYGYIVQGFHDSVQCQKRRIGFLSLLVKIFFDARTNIDLRNNLSALLVRLLSSSTRQVEVATRSLTEAEISRLLKEVSSPKKRKRTSEQRPMLTTYEWKDVQAIAQVLLQFRASKKELTTSLQSFCQGLFKSEKPIANGPRAALLVSLLQGILLNSDPDILGQFRQLVGTSFSIFLRRLIQSTLEARPSFVGGFNKGMNKHVMVLSSVLRFCTTACETFGRDSNCVPIEDLCRLISYCTGKSFLEQRAVQDPSLHLKLGVVLGAIDLLRSIGRAIPSSCSPDHLEVRT